MSAVIQTIESVEPHGENLSIVTTSGGNKVIANKRDDGSFRWTPGELVVYVSEGSIIPEDVLKERGYWDETKDRGLLDGGKRNRVKMKKLAGFESRGLLFKVLEPVDAIPEPHIFRIADAYNYSAVTLGQDVSEFFGITEFEG